MEKKAAFDRQANSGKAGVQSAECFKPHQQGIHPPGWFWYPNWAIWVSPKNSQKAKRVAFRYTFKNQIVNTAQLLYSILVNYTVSVSFTLRPGRIQRVFAEVCQAEVQRVFAVRGLGPCHPAEGLMFFICSLAYISYAFICRVWRFYFDRKGFVTVLIKSLCVVIQALYWGNRGVL